MQGTPAVTLRDIARTLGVSHVTVSLALRDSPEVSPARRKEIHEAARRMGYQPNPTAKALAHFKQTSKAVAIKSSIAWLNKWPNPSDLYKFREFKCYWKGARAAAEKLGYRLEEFVCTDRVATERTQKILFARGIDGILIPPHPKSPDWDGFLWDNFSAVRLGRSVQTPAVHLVGSDQVANAMLAIQKIRERGYERIAFVMGGAWQRGVLFSAGFLLSQYKLEPELRLPLFELGETNQDSDQRRFTAWLKTARPDAILTDVARLPDMLKKAGYRVPADVGLAALSILDGNADAGIDQNPEEIGRVAVLVVVSLIIDHALGIPTIRREILIEGSWVDGSTLPHRTAPVTPSLRRSQPKRLVA